MLEWYIWMIRNTKLYIYLCWLFTIIIIATRGWVVNGVRRHAEPLGDNDPPQLCQQDAEDGYRNTFRVLGIRSAHQ